MADLLDIVSLADARTALKVKGTARDLELAVYITAASRALDNEFGPVVKRAITGEVHDGYGTEDLRQSQQAYRHVGGMSNYGRYVVRLNYEPVASIASVVEYQGLSPLTLTAEANGTWPTDGYRLEQWPRDPALSTCVVERRSGGAPVPWWPGKENVVVSYTAGRFADTASVDALFKLAAFLVLRNAWGSDGPTVERVGEFDVPSVRFPKVGIPAAVKELLDIEADIPGFA